MISSGENFCNCGRIRFSNAARNLALPSSEASGALTMVSCSPALAAGAGAGKQRHLMRRAIHHGRIVPEDILRAVAVMDIEIDDRRAADAVFALGVAGGNGDIVEEAEAIGFETSA